MEVNTKKSCSLLQPHIDFNALGYVQNSYLCVNTVYSVTSVRSNLFIGKVFSLLLDMPNISQYCLAL